MPMNVYIYTRVSSAAQANDENVSLDLQAQTCLEYAKENIKQRVQNLLDSGIRVFYHPSFDDPKERKNILSEMPGEEKFKKDACKVKKLGTNKVSPEMRPCYEAPLLNFEQEQHLFRKMNYFKFTRPSYLHR